MERIEEEYISHVDQREFDALERDYYKCKKENSYMLDVYASKQREIKLMKTQRDTLAFAICVIAFALVVTALTGCTTAPVSDSNAIVSPGASPEPSLTSLTPCPANIINGREDALDPAIVKVSIDIPTNVAGVNLQSLCTGGLLDAQTVVLAKHCFTGSGVNHNVNGNKLKQVFMNDSASHDFAVAKLERPIKCASNFFTLGAAKVGQAVTIAGFGCNETNLKSDKKFRSGSTVVSKIDNRNIEMPGLPTYSIGCPGDSGGAAWVTGTLPRQAIGVLSRVTLDWSLQTFTRVDSDESKAVLRKAGVK
jgi:hypothetical protein